MKPVKRVTEIACFSLLLAALSAQAQQEDAPEATTPTAEAAAPEDGAGPGDDAAVEAPPVPEDGQVPVAEDDLGSEAVAPPAEETREDQLVAEFERFKELMDNEAYDEADSSAKRIIELAIQTSGPDSIQMARALTNLGIVQHRNGQFELAQQNFEAAIEIIEDTEDRLNAQLVNPLKGLAEAQLDSGRPDLAAETYGRAVHVTHVNAGPHNLEQVDLLESLAEVQLRVGDIEGAKEIQDRIHGLNIRAYNLGEAELIPALMRRADWQHRAGLIYDERTTYRRIIRLIEDQKGKDDLALVEPLVRLGRSFFYYDTSGQASFQEASMSSGEVYFKRAVRIAAESPETNWRIVTDATLALGDYYMFDGNSQRAKQVYVTVWDLLSEDENNDSRLDKRHAELETPVLLRSFNLPRFVGESDPELAAVADDPVREGSITVTFDVSTRGRAENLQLVEALPPEFTDMQKSVQREIRRRVFRPVFVDGEPVDSPDHVLVHTFSYRQSELDAARNGPPADGDEAT